MYLQFCFIYNYSCFYNCLYDYFSIIISYLYQLYLSYIYNMSIYYLSLKSNDLSTCFDSLIIFAYLSIYPYMFVVCMYVCMYVFFFFFSLLFVSAKGSRQPISRFLPVPFVWNHGWLLIQNCVPLPGMLGKSCHRWQKSKNGLLSLFGIGSHGV